MIKPRPRDPWLYYSVPGFTVAIATINFNRVSFVGLLWTSPIESCWWHKFNSDTKLISVRVQNDTVTRFSSNKSASKLVRSRTKQHKSCRAKRDNRVEDTDEVYQWAKILDDNTQDLQEYLYLWDITDLRDFFLSKWDHQVELRRVYIWQMW